MKLAMFSAQAFERPFFTAANAGLHHDIVFYTEALYAQTAGMAEGFAAVCAFVDDKLDAPTLEALRRGGTRLVALRAAGYNDVALDAAKKFGIAVMRVPAYAPPAIAGHAVALMLTLNRHVHKAYNWVRDGDFDLNGLVGFNMAGKTVGIVGTGKIGTALARILKGFGCTLIGHDPYQNPECLALGLRYLDLPALLAQSDIVSVHCALTPDSRHMINAETIALMKPSAMLINTARGGLVDARAAIDALKSRERLACFGLDVYQDEGPLFFSDRSMTVIQDDVFERMTTFPNVVITAHQAFLTREALSEIAHVTLGNVSDFEAGRPEAENVVVAGGPPPQAQRKSA